MRAETCPENRIYENSTLITLSDQDARCVEQQQDPRENAMIRS